MELHSELEYEVWEQVVVETIGYYAVMMATKTVDPDKISQEDLELIEDLKRSIDQFFLYDESLELKYDINKIVENNIALNMDAAKVEKENKEARAMLEKQALDIDDKALNKDNSDPNNDSGIYGSDSGKPRI